MANIIGFNRAKSSSSQLALVTLPVATFFVVLFVPVGESTQPSATVMAFQQPSQIDHDIASFAKCSGSVRITCIVDGDTIWYQGEKIRVADINAPEVTNPGCANEAALGREATVRLQALLNAGAFTIAPNPSGDKFDRYGRSLKLITRNGQSLGQTLVNEALASEWDGLRREWC